MAPSILALLGVAALTLALILLVVGYRGFIIGTGKSPANSWTRDGEKWANPAFITRAEHAHANCVEMLPLLAAVILSAAALNQLAVTNGLAIIFLLARLGQSITHVISASHIFVLIRATFFFVQIIILIIWLVKLCGLA